MRKVTKFLIATALTTLFAAPALAQSLAYVGITPDHLPANIGVVGFHDACDAAFPGSQFCTSEDIIRGGRQAPTT